MTVVASIKTALRMTPKQQQMEVGDLDDKFEEAKKARKPLEKKWLVALAFYEGLQWHKWSDAHWSLIEVKVPEYRVLPVINLIKPTVRTEYAKLIQNRPTAFIQPKSDEPSDILNARVLTKVSNYQEKTSGEAEANRRSLLWSLICGTGIDKVYWDKDKGPVITDDTRGISFPIGEVCVIHVSPFEFYPEPGGETMDEKDWVFHVKLRSKDYVENKYKRTDIPEDSLSDEDTLEGRLDTMLGQRTSETEKKGILVREFHQRPSRKYEQGRFAVYAGDKLLESSEGLYPKVPVPFVSWQYIPKVKSFWGSSIIDDLIDPQKSYNKTRGQIHEMRNLTAKNKWIGPIGALPLGKTITSAPGEYIEYTPIAGFKPEPVKGLEVPQTMWKDLDTTRQEINEISGQHEVSRAQVPGQVKAGVAIQALQEQDDLRLTPTSQTFEDAIKREREYLLYLGKQFYTEQRTARVVGQGKRTEVVEFYADDIPDDIEVSIQSGSSLPKSRVARHAILQEYWTLGLIRDPKIILKLAEFDEVEGVFDDINRDTAQAQRENDSMKAGQARQANDYDNASVHVYEHNSFRKSEEFEQLPPPTQQIFAEHLAQHMAHAQNAMMQSQQTGMAPPGQDTGGAGGAGGPPPPKQLGAGGAGAAPPPLG